MGIIIMFMYILMLNSNIYADTNVTIGKNCTTPMRTEGICVDINNCKYLFETFLTYKRENSDAAYEVLMQAKCAGDETNIFVCCDEVIMNRININKSTRTVLEYSIMNETDKTLRFDIKKHPNLKLLNHSTCGNKLTQKIYGGKITTIFEFPWMVMLMYSSSADKFRKNRTICSGTLINNRYILTAAHCVSHLPPEIKLVSVILGKHTTEISQNCEQRNCPDRYKEIAIEKIDVFPKFSYYNLHHDIALVRLQKEVLKSSSIQSICLPIGTAAEIRQPWMVTFGWGKMENGKRSTILRKVGVRLTSDEECSKAYKSITRIWPDQICAGGRLNRDSCQGDSGGPLQGPGMYNNDARWIQYGIVSFGKDCGYKNRPGVYTNVTFYTRWILDTIQL